MKDILDLLARMCLATLFIYEAYDTIAFFKDTREKMTSYGINWGQDFFLYASATFLVVGALFLLIGYRAKFASLLLLLYWVPMTFFAHSWWNDPVDIQRIQSIFFMRNIAIAGGLLLMAASGSGRWSVKRLIDRQRIKVKNL